MNNKHLPSGRPHVRLDADQIKKIDSLQPPVNRLRIPSQSRDNSICGDVANTKSSSGCCASTDTPLPSTATEPGAPCCGPRVLSIPRYIPAWQKDSEGIRRVDATLRFTDTLGAVRARLGKYRMNYAIEPGLYALGAPDKHSDVLVTANYKLSFDQLRSQLNGRHLWILVLNTYGINVWCAAGKGTFGTQELIRQIRESGLKDRVCTRKCIVPQLGGPGIAAHQVKAETGFQVLWGPVEAKDVGAFIDNHYKATADMREKKFPLKERLVLLPIELRPAMKLILCVAAIAGPLAALAFPGEYLRGLVHYAVLIGLYLFAGVLSGAVATPLLLPFLPGRAFTVKSIWPSAAILVSLGYCLRHQIYFVELIALSLVAASIAAYAAMNFTGASTYTSLSGVKKEMRVAVPIEIAGAALGVLVWISAQLMG